MSSVISEKSKKYMQLYFYSRMYQFLNYFWASLVMMTV